MTSIPETRYALNGQIHLAYQVLGEEPPTTVGVNAGPGSHTDHQWRNRVRHAGCTALKRARSWTRSG